MSNGFFGQYVFIGWIVFAFFLAVSLLLGILLGKIIKKKWIAILIVIISVSFFYLLDLDYSFLFLGILGVVVFYFYLFKINK
jgi:hypothetical protein